MTQPRFTPYPGDMPATSGSSNLVARPTAPSAENLSSLPYGASKQDSSAMSLEQNTLSSLNIHQSPTNSGGLPPPDEDFALSAATAVPMQPVELEAPQKNAVEYSSENYPQLIVSNDSSLPELSPGAARPNWDSDLPEVSFIRGAASPTISTDSGLIAVTSLSRSQSIDAPVVVTRKPLASPRTSSRSSSFATAREDRVELQDRPVVARTETTDSGITLISSRGPLRHTRQPGKLTAYLIPFPKPHLKNIRPEDIPERFLVYTPPPPPLSRPAPGEKESHWHKTRRLWQEDVRKAMMSNSSRWKGMKATSIELIGKSVNMTRSTNVEFLDRAAEGAITSMADAAEEEMAELDTSPTPEAFECKSRKSSRSTKSSDSIPPPQDLEDLTLVYPPTLDLPPEKIRAEFVDSLSRTREKSHKEAVFASSLVPVAAVIDASLIVTLGGLTEVSGVWAYTSIRGSTTSKKLAQGLARGEELASSRGCTCVHHEEDSSPIEKVASRFKSKKKEKPSINLFMHPAPQLEVLRRYLAICCLKKEYNFFPTIQEAAGDVNEQAVLEAIGWEPVTRSGLDLDMELKDRTERLTAAQDELWQTKEARDDVRRLMKKGANEWVAWCKTFAKDPKEGIKR